MNLVTRLQTRKINLGFSNRILGRALGWMGLGLALIITFAWATLEFPNFANVMVQIGNWYWLFLILNIGLSIGFSFLIANPRQTLGLAIVCYLAFVVFQAIFTSTTIVYSGIDLQNLILLMLIPSGIFLIMGIIAYFDWFDMTKLWPIATFGSLALLIMGLVLIFIQSQLTMRWWLLLAAGLFIIYIGIDMQIIVNNRHHQWLTNDHNEKQQINKLALMMGLVLLLDFVNLLRIIINLWRTW